MAGLERTYQMKITKEEHQSLLRGSAGRILLLGGDDAMARRILRSLPDCSLVREDTVFEGIRLLAEKPFSTVLVNAETLRLRTADAVRGLRRVNGKVRLLLYGQAFSEGYCREGITCGADDYMIQPIPSEELRRMIAPEIKTASSAMPAEPDIEAEEKWMASEPNGALLRFYQQAAEQIPQGVAALIELAKQMLPPLLGAAEVEILWLESAENQDADSIKPDEAEGMIFPLRVLQETKGFFIVRGQNLHTDPALSRRARQAADFLAVLLNLAKRDEGLRRLAVVDELTGVYNRRYLEYFVRQIIRQSPREKCTFTLLLCDIDDFKHYNDTYGHAAGDEILREATRLLKLCCREHDVVARVGGDDLGVLFWGCGISREAFPRSGDEIQQDSLQLDLPEQADLQSDIPPLRNPAEAALFLSNRFRRKMRTAHFPSLGPEARGVLTVSGGLASFPHDGQTVEDLMQKADDALLEAKRSGKNRIYLVGRP